MKLRMQHPRHTRKTHSVVGHAPDIINQLQTKTTHAHEFVRPNHRFAHQTAIRKGRFGNQTGSDSV